MILYGGRSEKTGKERGREKGWGRGGVKTQVLDLQDGYSINLRQVLLL